MLSIQINNFENLVCELIGTVGNYDHLQMPR